MAIKMSNRYLNSGQSKPFYLLQCAQNENQGREKSSWWWQYMWLIIQYLKTHKLNKAKLGVADEAILD